MFVSVLNTDTSDSYFDLFLEPAELFPDFDKKTTKKKTVTPHDDDTLSFK